MAFTTREVEKTKNVLSSMLLTKDLRNVINVAHIMHTQHILHRHITEQRNLLLGLLFISNTKRKKKI